MPIPPAFITVMSLFSERSFVSGFGRMEDNYSTYLYLMKHILLCVSGTYWSWLFVRKATCYIESHIHKFFVPSTLRYIGTLGSALRTNPRISIFYMTKDDHTFNQLFKNNRDLHADKFNDAISILYKWTQLSGVKKLSSLFSAENFSSTDDLFSRKIIIELFNTYRSTRLKTLLHYLNDSIPNYYGSQELAGALSTLIVMTIGFPEHVYINASSRFRFIDSIMVDALRASQDSYVFDFVLDCIVIPSASESNLFQDFENVKNTPTSNKYSTPIINAFSKPSFMLSTVPGIKNGLFEYKLRRHAFSFFQNICSFYNTEHKDVYVNFFETHTGEILSEIKKIHFMLQTSNNYPFTKEGILAAHTSDMDETNLDFEKYHLIFVAPDADETHHAYNAISFKKNIQDRREQYALIKSRIERIQANINMDLYTKTCTHSTTTECFNQLQKSQRMLLSKFKQYQGHVFQYEKTFAAYQVIKFLSAFKFEIENVLQNRSKLNTWCGDNSIENTLKRFSACTFVARAADRVYKHYNGPDKTYNNSEYINSVATIRNDLSEVTQTLYHKLNKTKAV